MNRNPQVKFQPSEEVRAGLEAQADHYRIGHNGNSANEIMKLIASVMSRVPKEKLFQALAAVENEFCSHSPKRARLKRSISDHL